MTRIEGMAVKHDAYLNVSTTTTVNTVTVNTNRIYARMIVYCRFSDKQYKLALPKRPPERPTQWRHPPSTIASHKGGQVETVTSQNIDNQKRCWYRYYRRHNDQNGDIVERRQTTTLKLLTVSCPSYWRKLFLIVLLIIL